MRSLAETKNRWEETLKASASFAELQRAVKFNGPGSPCVAGSRSVCWKAFLLFHDAAPANWSHILLETRNTYSTLRDHYLKYIKHPEQLAELSLDPLADDPESPWDAFRRDEVIRAEILQDVRRLPDEPFYQQESTQTLILDILFIYCKLNPDVGGYRQGMHELLAPLLFVVSQDALTRAEAETDGMVDPVMVEMLDSYFIEHDAFALFSKIMEKAKSFYEVSNPTAATVGSLAGVGEQNTIVEMSREIHEVTLMKVDPELAQHLKSIEVLPQIFLIRWIRLLFGREFPFEQLLVLWDTIFAFDPTLDLIPLVCVAMLIRIRWTLLEADYSVALQLLLKYPAPQAPHGPHTFVDDAVYLRSHLNFSGGSNLILKYTGRAPEKPAAPSPRPSTPTLAGLGLRQRTLGARSPLSSPARFIQNRETVEALFQGAAKGVLERGEKLGFNQAVRDAMSEIKRNVQGLQEARNSAGRSSGRDPFFGEALPSRSVGDMDRRNRRLASLLDETVDGLKAAAALNNSDHANDKVTEAIELAAAKVQFVRVYLEDSSLALPEEEDAAPSVNALSFTSNKENVVPTVAVDKTVVTMSTAPHESREAAAVVMVTPPMQTSGVLDGGSGTTPIVIDSPRPDDTADAGDKMETDSPAASPNPNINLNDNNNNATNTTAASSSSTTTAPTSAAKPPTAAPPPATHPARPKAPIPTRSTLAQSSFSWMLEPDTTTPSSGRQPFPAARGSSGGHRKRPSGSGSVRSERNAFLFGEVTSSDSGDEGRRPLTSDEIFGLEPLRKALPKQNSGN